MTVCVMAVVAVPVLLARRGPDDFTRPGSLDRTAPALHQAAACHTAKVWPTGRVRHAVWVPGSNMTLAPNPR
jgi:hypothetical protein